MKSRAAVLSAPGAEWVIEDIDLDPPQAGEVLVDIKAAGLCHSDHHLVNGDMVIDPVMAEAMGLSQFPMIGGHEGAGIVLEVGAGVSNVAPGDHVVFSFVPACGRCPSCAIGQQHLCDLGQFLLAGKQISDFTSRHHRSDGSDVSVMCCLGTFAPFTVVNEASCIKIEPDIPMEQAALVGCGVTTGWGSAANAADVRVGETVVVVGAGGVGMNAVQGASMCGARHVVVVDPEEFKRTQSTVFGGTHTAASMADAHALVSELTHGRMADKAILTVSLATGDLISPLLGLVKKGGRAVCTSIAPMTQMDVQLNLFDFTMQRKELVGCIFGNANPRRDINRLLSLYSEGKLKLDELVTKTYTLEEINKGYQDMMDGSTLRGVITFD